MVVTSWVPARINLLGNPTDGLEGEYSTISCAIDLGVQGRFDFCKRTSSRQYGYGPGSKTYSDCQKLLDAVLRRSRSLPDFSESYENQEFRVDIINEIPEQSGLGGSSALINMFLVGLRELYGLDSVKMNDYMVAELCTRIEYEELSTVCGYSDRYSTLFGGIAYIDYRGKLNHRSIEEEPYATYEDLSRFACRLPIVIIGTGIRRSSGSVHSRMRSLFMEEIMEPEHSQQSMLQVAREIGETAWRGKKALLSHDLEFLGFLMNENHDLTNHMMRLSGFRDGAGKANNFLVEEALREGALGAKLAGAGQGGSLVALLSEDTSIDDFKRRISRSLRSMKLTDGFVHEVMMPKRGYTVSKSPPDQTLEEAMTKDGQYVEQVT